jgi:hypothetical protein
MASLPRLRTPPAHDGRTAMYSDQLFGVSRSTAESFVGVLAVALHARLRSFSEKRDTPVAAPRVVAASAYPTTPLHPPGAVACRPAQ